MQRRKTDPVKGKNLHYVCFGMANSILSAHLLLLLPLLFIGTFAHHPSADGNHPPADGGFPLGFGHAIMGADIGARSSGGHDVVKHEFKTGSIGKWEIHNKNAGVAAMQLQLLPNNKVVWFDTTNLGPSALQFDPPYCRPLPNNASITDCFAHAIEYDSVTGHVRPLKVCLYIIEPSFS